MISLVNIINCFLISQALPKNKLNCFKNDK